MKNTYPFFILFSIVGFFTISCNKEKGSVEPNALRLVDKITISDGNFNTYTYDTNGKCIRIDGKNFYTTYAYGSNSVIETYKSSSASNPTIYTYILNVKGLAEKKIYTIGSYTYEYLYEYDTQGYLSKTIFQSRATNGVSAHTILETTQIYRDADGDLLSLNNMATSSSGLRSYSITYSIDKKNYNTTGIEFRGLQWQGKTAHHPIVSMFYKYSDGKTETRYFTNQYDDKGYIQKTDVTGTASGFSPTTYSYSYK